MMMELTWGIGDKQEFRCIPRYLIKWTEEMEAALTQYSGLMRPLSSSGEDRLYQKNDSFARVEKEFLRVGLNGKVETYLARWNGAECDVEKQVVSVQNGFNSVGSVQEGYLQHTQREKGLIDKTDPCEIPAGGAYESDRESDKKNL